MENNKIPEFLTKAERIAYLKKNKALLIKSKKSNIKHSDGYYMTTEMFDTVKKKVDTTDRNEINAKVVINTTNIMDSHSDVHLPGIWNKSLQENKNMMHLQEHQMQFDKIIADGDDLKVHTIKFNWSDIGQPYSGTTEALIFDSTIKRSRNEFMFKQYSEDRVKNHSVGMQYVKLLLALDDETEAEEFAVWEKFINQIANKQDAIDQGYFWAVTEAKVIEGSAVPIGSNQATPTLEVKQFKAADNSGTLSNNKYESLFLKPSRHTSQEKADLTEVYQLINF